MFVLTILLFIAIALVILFTLKLMNVIKENDYHKVVRFMNTYVNILFVGVFVIYITMMIVSMVEISSSEYVFVVFIKLLIHLLFFISIFILSRKLIHNLKASIIFNQQNATYIHQIGSQFIYMSIVEILIGFVVGIISFLAGSTTRDFMIQTNTTLLLFVLFGLILLLVSFVLKKAIELYEENQLTI